MSCDEAFDYSNGSQFETKTHILAQFSPPILVEPECDIFCDHKVASTGSNVNIRRHKRLQTYNYKATWKPTSVSNTVAAGSIVRKGPIVSRKRGEGEKALLAFANGRVLFVESDNL